MASVITGTGTVLPEMVVKNDYFLNNTFYDKNGIKSEKPTAEVIQKLEQITGITERRYVPFDQDSVPLMKETALKTLANAGLTPNDLSGIIVAHNAGNMVANTKNWQPIPNMGALLKNAIDCRNHECFAYDILFGCPGWVQGVIAAHQAVSNGAAKHVLVLGHEVISRLIDPADLDSMIFADGSGACIISASDDNSKGVLGYATFSHANEDLKCIYIDKGLNPNDAHPYYLHMTGKDVYRYATTWLPQVVKKSLDNAKVEASEIDLFLFHQANGKMLEVIAGNFAELVGINPMSMVGKVPVIIQYTGNTSVATVPTLLGLVMEGKVPGYSIKPGMKVVMASVGAGMHCNSVVYQF
jgi:3-oxoacyl-[acyl-carrier-protein] synthase III